jgi:hypothetical protein
VPHAAEVAPVEVVPVEVAPADISPVDPLAMPDEVPEMASEEFVKELPEEVLGFLVRSAPSREVWKWLSDEKRRELLAKVTRGFQRTANALRQPQVRNRLTQHLRVETEAFFNFLHLWGETKPEPHAVTDVRALPDDEALIAQLPQLWHHHGAEALLLALVLDNRRTALDALDSVAEQVIEDVTASAEQDESPPEEETGSIADQLEQMVSEAEEWRQRAAAAQTTARAAEANLQQVQAVLTTAREQQRREAHAYQTQIKQEQRRVVSAEENLQETKKLFDRASRRLKSSEKETADLLAESKRLKRQLRRQQQLNEELRKQLTQVTAKLQSVEEAKAAARPAVPSTPAPRPAAPPKVVVPAVAPLDQPFIWKSDGRPFRITPREVQRAINRNDEEFVFTLIQAFDALRETNEAGYRLFLSRVREFDRYYSRVLTVDTTRVLVDASNVARYESDRFGKGQLRHLLAMRDELRRRDCFPILIYADASLPYHIDESAELLAMVKRGELQLTASGQEADEVLAREARRTGAYVVTNDRNFHTKVSPDFEPPRITFRIFDGHLVVDDF